jgi:hypothetical protein
MGTIFTLTSDIRDVSRTLLDDMLEELGKTVRCIYAPVQAECPSCLLDPITNRSSNRPQSGALVSFEEGQTCPTCEGHGYVVSEVPYDDIKASVSRNPKAWQEIVPPSVVVPDGVVYLKTYTSNWAKIMRARYVILAPEMSGIQEERLMLHSVLRDPSNLVPGRYTVGIFKPA